MTTRQATRLKPLPDPPRDPDSMQQLPFIAMVIFVLRMYFSHRSDVLVNGEGYLCLDTRIRPGQLKPDCVVAFGVDPKSHRRTKRLRHKRSGQAARLRSRNRLCEHRSGRLHHQTRRIRRIRCSRILAFRPKRRPIPTTARSRATLWWMASNRPIPHEPRTRRLGLGTQPHTGTRSILARRKPALLRPGHIRIPPRLLRSGEPTRHRKSHAPVRRSRNEDAQRKTAPTRIGRPIAAPSRRLPTSHPCRRSPHSIVIPTISTFIPAIPTVIPAIPTVIPAIPTVIPAKAGNPRIKGTPCNTERSAELASKSPSSAKARAAQASSDRSEDYSRPNRTASSAAASISA